MSQRIFWYKDLPPLRAQPVSEEEIDAQSEAVPLGFGADEPWSQCYDSLRAVVEGRLQQELDTHRADLAHVVKESIHPKHDHAAGRYHLEGRFSYVLYRLA